jgi:hypothetical protein
MLTSWDYMWRTTPLHRQEVNVEDQAADQPPRLSAAVDTTDVIGPDDGHGPMFHRRYTTRIRDPQIDSEKLFALLAADLNQAAPTTFARFQKVRGRKGRLTRGEEYVVRMPGPWDGPVRVVDRQPRSFRLATLSGHLEAGQIEFHAEPGDSGTIDFTIESWTRSSGRLSNLLYHRLRMAKEIQLHMWISFLEGVVALSGGRMTGGIEIITRRVDPATS